MMWLLDKINYAIALILNILWFIIYLPFYWITFFFGIWLRERYSKKKKDASAYKLMFYLLYPIYQLTYLIHDIIRRNKK